MLVFHRVKYDSWDMGYVVAGLLTPWGIPISYLYLATISDVNSVE